MHNEKRAFHREKASSKPGVLVIGERNIGVMFNDISLLGAQVQASEENLPPVGSAGTLHMDSEHHRMKIRCKVVGLEKYDHYRLKFAGMEEESLDNLMNLLTVLSGGRYNPREDLPRLTLYLDAFNKPVY